MHKYLMALAARLMGTLGPGEFPSLPHDRDSGVRQPRTRHPGGRSSAVAVAEPEESEPAQADAWRSERQRAGGRASDSTMA